jgi:hypothetical protein
VAAHLAASGELERADVTVAPPRTTPNVRRLKRVGKHWLVWCVQLLRELDVRGLTVRALSYVGSLTSATGRSAESA